MDKKTIIALLLILATFWISSELLWKNKQQPAADQYKESSETEVVEKAPTATEIPSKIPEIIQENPEEIAVANDIVLMNDLLKITFSNLGGVIKSVQLNEYFLTDKETNVELIPVDQSLLNLEIVEYNGNSSNLANRIFQYSKSDDNSLNFSLQTGNGIIEKRFRLIDNYQLEFEIDAYDLDQNIDYRLSLESGIADTEENLKTKSMDYKIYTQLNNKLEKIKLAKLKEKKEFSGNIDWVGIRSKYFVIGIIPEKPINLNKLEMFNSNNSPAARIGVQINRRNFKHKYQMYFGPVIKNYLVQFHPGFDKVQEGPFIEIIRPISSFFTLIFKLLRKVIPSYGIIIIVFAILLKIILNPLTHKSFESSTKMQKIQPLMKNIQAKYKSDPRQMQVELKKLYKEHGVSPLGGCLPLLLQMPIFFAIYPVIRYSIDLRQNSFLWLPDLSEPDRLLILPIAMAIFMFVQQKLMTPSKQTLDDMDDKQKATAQSQKMMMYVMPVMMFFIFKSLSSGLVLYWTVFSIMSSVQQYFIKKKFN
ncbi:MAG: membrane protein insertase YidC [Candidatus Cloacimonetes bacterium]|nr:membrane protein insertase YidC [Candidatus Cloacimonadota bacterium]